jgi:hypothetical protein
VLREERIAETLERQFPEIVATEPARCRSGSRARVSNITCGRPIHGGANSGRKVMITRTRSVATRSMSRSSDSRLVGSLQ